jgi:hypothetical protein
MDQWQLEVFDNSSIDIGQIRGIIEDAQFNTTDLGIVLSEKNSNFTFEENSPSTRPTTNSAQIDSSRDNLGLILGLSIGIPVFLLLLCLCIALCVCIIII